MKNSLKTIKLEDIKKLSGKKDDKNNIYYYLDFKFNLYKMGDSADGISLYRITPINFDTRLLKSFSKKTFIAKGYSTIESNDIKLTLKNTFDEILRIKTKKEFAKKAYEKALKEGKIPVEETTVKTDVTTTKKAMPKVAKSFVRKKIEFKIDPKLDPTSYKTSNVKKSDNKSGMNKFNKKRPTSKRKNY